MDRNAFIGQEKTLTALRAIAVECGCAKTRILILKDSGKIQESACASYQKWLKPKKTAKKIGIIKPAEMTSSAIAHFRKEVGAISSFCFDAL